MNILLKRITDLNKDLIIREAKSTDAPGFIKLMNDHYIRQKRKEYFLWRYFSCPTPSIMYVITRKDNTLIGAYGLNVFTLINGLKCGVTADLIISKTFANRGLFFLLENKIKIFAKKNDCSYLICFPNLPGMKAHVKIGWQLIGKVTTLTYHKEKEKIKKKLPNNNSDKNIYLFDYKEPLLHWRFDENPEYKYLQIKSGSQQSYIKTFHDTVRNLLFGDIVYYTSSLHSKSDFSKLISLSIQRLKTMNTSNIITWCSNKSPLYPIFIALGFRPEIQPRYLCIKQLSSKAVDPKQINWQVLPSDSDVF